MANIHSYMVNPWRENENDSRNGSVGNNRLNQRQDRSMFRMVVILKLSLEIGRERGKFLIYEPFDTAEVVIMLLMICQFLLALITFWI